MNADRLFHLFIILYGVKISTFQQNPAGCAQFNKAFYSNCSSTFAKISQTQ